MAAVRACLYGAAAPMAALRPAAAAAAHRAPLLARQAARFSVALRASVGVAGRSGAEGAVGAAGAGLARRAALVGASGRRTLFIGMQPTPNPDSMKFLPEGKQVLPPEFGTGRDYRNVEETKGAPLARQLFLLEGVTGVFLGPDFVSVSKQEELDWAELRPQIFGVIMDAYASGKPLVTRVEGAHDTAAAEEDDEVVEMIKELIETRIRPAVQDDGGDILFEGFDPEDGIVTVRLAGACVGCGSSEITLRNGVENMLMHYIPEVKGLAQAGDELQELSKEEFETMEQRLAAAGLRE
uniref:Scaffold protein Nfu/NifU N-terminal domain-containing protein n=1 Tax=Bicosoecida sp. CB-2014 TaxID=1486930 RepID=A0A7S1G454_9STRA